MKNRFISLSPQQKASLGLQCKTLLAADKGGLYPLNPTVPALPSRQGWALNRLLYPLENRSGKL
jgi:hypothetical protein